MSRSHLKHNSALAGLVLMGVISLGVSAEAQTPAPETTPAPTKPADTKPADAKPADPGTVTVVGEKPANRIDRQTYDNTKNIDSQSGTAADALNKVPSVNVDPSGNVTLRGQSNVQVMIDGKPSAMMSGDNRAAALQAMSSGDIQSVEVINNPGAQFGSEGSGGIINLVLRKNRKPGKSGSVSANIGSAGRYNGSLSGNYSSSKMTITGGINTRHDKRESSAIAVYNAKDPTTGAVTRSTTQTGEGSGEMNNTSANAGIDYTLGDNDSVSAQINMAHREFNTDSYDVYTTKNAVGTVTGNYGRKSVSKGPRDDGGIDLRWDHKGKLPGETLKVGLRLSTAGGTTKSLGTSVYTVPVKTDVEPRWTSSNSRNGVFSIDYNRPVGDSILTTGIQIQRDEANFKNSAWLNGAVNPNGTNQFRYEQTLSAVYATYQVPLGTKWTVLGGVRVEQLDLDTHQVSPTATDGHISYAKVNPSFFATRALSDRANLRFSYSHRLRRPGQQDLNPFVTFVDERNVSMGNPNLKPQETESYELGYEFTAPVINYQIRGYYREHSKIISNISYYDTDGRLVTTKQNAGSGSDSGLEANAQGALSKKLRIGVNSNIFHKELTTPNVDGTQEATSIQGRVSLDYAITPKDRAQFMIFSSGKQLTGQGYTSPFTMANLSYRHNFSQKFALIATLNDPFQMGKQEIITDSKTVYNKSTRKIGGQIFYVGLSYNFGGTPSTSQQQGQQQGPRMGPGGPGVM